jgi:hypothetical protein
VTGITSFAGALYRVRGSAGRERVLHLSAPANRVATVPELAVAGCASDKRKQSIRSARPVSGDARHETTLTACERFSVSAPASTPRLRVGTLLRSRPWVSVLAMEVGAAVAASVASGAAASALSVARGKPIPG